MTREQLGQALQYSDPRVAITKIHTRNKDRLDKFSGVTNLVLPKGGTQETTIYRKVRKAHSFRCGMDSTVLK
jgi:hypothetical protein